MLTCLWLTPRILFLFPASRALPPPPSSQPLLRATCGKVFNGTRRGIATELGDSGPEQLNAASYFGRSPLESSAIPCPRSGLRWFRAFSRMGA